MIHEFYVVTDTSVYHVTDEMDERDNPIVEKIALAGESVFPVGHRFDCTYVVGIMHYLVSYWDTRHRPDMVNTRYWGDKSSPITALFTDKELALRCLEEPDRHAFDTRWENETRRILEEIGSDHPVFVLGQGLLERVMSGDPLGDPRYPQ